MLKNKFKLITILFMLILTLTFPIVRADDETTGGAVITDATVSDNPEMISDSDVNSNNLKKGDEYLIGDNIVVDYIVDGNLFVLADTVTINSQIGGDAFICANNIIIGESGYVFSNLFSVSKYLTIDGIVYDIYSVAENININGYVYRDIRVTSSELNIFGTVGRNAFVAFKNLNFSKDENTANDEQTELSAPKQGVINGNLTYSSDEEYSIEKNCVAGETIFNKTISTSEKTTIGEYIFSLVTFVVTVIVIWLLCLWRTPNFLKNITSFITTKKVWPTVGFGILAPIASLIVAILLIIFGVTSTIGLLLLLTFFMLITISSAIFVIAINYIICNKLKIEKTMSILGVLSATSAILWLIKLIPFVGSLVGLISGILGLGIVVSNIVLKEKNEDN